MNLTTEDYENINNLIQTNEDENKAIAAGIIANMDEEQFLDWLQSFVCIYYPPLAIQQSISSHFQYTITFPNKIELLFYWTKDGNILGFESNCGVFFKYFYGGILRPFSIPISKDGAINRKNWRMYLLPLVIQAFKDLFK